MKQSKTANPKKEFDTKEVNDLEQIQKKAKSVQKDLSTALEGMKNIKFSDAQVIEFISVLFSRSDEISYEAVTGFMTALAEQGKITPKQEAMFLDEYEKRNAGHKKTKTKPASKTSKSK